VQAFSTANLSELFAQFEQRLDTSDYLVAWIDCFARGKALGRAAVHQANYLHKGEDPNPAQSLRVENQELPDSLFGLIPKSLMWRFMKLFSRPLGMRLINWAKYTASATIGNHKTYLDTHAGFAFLLDYVPNWKWVYKPGGLIQYQSFVPAETAQECFAAQLRLCQERNLVSWLGVFKRHRRDDFLMSHGVNGYSLALDFPVNARNRDRLWALAQELNKLVLAAGGRFYFAKDSTLDADSARQFLGADALAQFTTLKQQCDPEHLLQTNLSQRLFDF
jgi:decaprenylphospho-beta-D-ribofuranose 2-oxidase